MSPCVVLEGKGLMEMPFATPLRLTGSGLTLELLVRLDALPAQGKRAFLLGAQGTIHFHLFNVYRCITLYPFLIRPVHP